MKSAWDADRNTVFLRAMGDFLRLRVDPLGIRHHHNHGAVGRSLEPPRPDEFDAAAVALVVTCFTDCDRFRH